MVSFIRSGAAVTQGFKEVAHSAPKFHAKPEQGPLQFPAHNNSANKERRVMTGSRRGFSSLYLDCHGPAGTHAGKLPTTLTCPKREDAQSVGISLIIFFQRIPGL